MKFINYLESIAGIAIYPMISLFIFFVFFSLLIVYVVKSDKQLIKELENMPLEKDGIKDIEEVGNRKFNFGSN